MELQLNDTSHLNDGNDRTEKARNENFEASVSKINQGNGTIVVTNKDKGSSYEVTVEDGTNAECSCNDFKYRGRDNNMACKHMRYLTVMTFQ